MKTDKDVYVHYGQPFDEQKFMPIKNGNFTKPRGGLWASRTDAKYGWKDWCKDEDFRECAESESFKFTLKDGTRILTINSCKDLESLPTREIFRPTTALDFEKLTQDYDAVEVIISDDIQLCFELYGWDCDSIVVMNKDCMELEESE